MLNSRPGLLVGSCVPFYFCPRSIMLFLIHRRNDELSYQDGQVPIIHLVADLRQTVRWAERQSRRWAFTLSNAGAFYVEDRCDLNQLGEIDWDAVEARDWQHCKEGKQAEFLLEHSFPWQLIERIGVRSHDVLDKVSQALRTAVHKPRAKIRAEWYY